MSPSSSRSQARRQRSWVISLGLIPVLVTGVIGTAVAGASSQPQAAASTRNLVALYRPAGPEAPSAAVLGDVVHVMRTRLRALGVSGATVSTQSTGGATDVVVSMPAVKGAHQILTAIGQTGQLYFRPVLCYAPAYAGPAAPQALPTGCTSHYQLVASNPSNGSTGGVVYDVGPTPALTTYPSSAVDDPTATVLLPGLTGAKADRYLLGPATLTGQIVKKALAKKTQIGRWVVTMSLTSAGSAEWDKMATRYFHEVIGIELDGIVQSAPRTLPTATSFRSFDGTVQISGSFTRQSAQNLALALNDGALPVRLIPESVRTVGGAGQSQEGRP